MSARSHARGTGHALLAGSTLLLAGAASWVATAAAAPGVLMGVGALYADPRYSSAEDPGLGDLTIALVDARMGSLLVMLCGIGILATLIVRRHTHVAVLVVACAAVLVLLSGLLSRGTLSPLVDGCLLLGTSGVVLAAAWSGGRGGERTICEPVVGRGLTVALSLLAAGAVPVLELHLPDPWVVGALPGLRVLGLAQAVVAVAALLLATLAAGRHPTPSRSLGLAIAGSGAALFVLGPPLPVAGWGLVLAGGVLLATVAAGATGRPGAASVAGAAYAVLLVPAVLVGLAPGVLALAAAGESLSVDGLPLLWGGPLAGLAAYAVLARLGHPAARSAWPTGVGVRGWRRVSTPPPPGAVR